MPRLVLATSPLLVEFDGRSLERRLHKRWQQRPFHFLLALCEHPGSIVSPSKLVEHLRNRWGRDWSKPEVWMIRNIIVQAIDECDCTPLEKRRLRDVLETVRGRGARIELSPEDIHIVQQMEDLSGGAEPQRHNAGTEAGMLRLIHELRYDELRGQSDLFVLVDSVPSTMQGLPLAALPWEFRLEGGELLVPELRSPSMGANELVGGIFAGQGSGGNPGEMDRALRIEVGLLVIARNVSPLWVREILQQVERLLIERNGRIRPVTYV